ncbi:unnamed protein product [Cyclocybe aegerita]|uniref:DUF6535 domain-containing protein n=1 Tax=Cyclocybe aegerita TaxID=1973307 RepID=A0A8S0XQS4_CYCAE|nr:unnamed protein product [Cyclocybe aegerita]
MSSSSSQTHERQKTAEFVEWKCNEKPYKCPLASEEKDPWTTLLAPLLEKDAARCHAWKEEVQNLLIFAGLFSAVVTAFIIDAYKTLEEDPNEAFRLYIIGHLGPAPQVVTIPSSDFSPTPSNVRINTLWFLSLVFSLATVLIGIVSLQWLREHQRPRKDLEPQIAFALHNMHIEALDRWYFPHIFTILPLLLQIGLVLFLCGVVDLLWSLNATVAIWVSIATGLTLLFLLITTALPTLQNLSLFLPRWQTSDQPRAPCPYKSPQSWAFHQLVAFILDCGMQTGSAPPEAYRRMDACTITSATNRKGWWQNMPRATAFIFRKKKGDTWLEHGIAWLFQRDLDYVQDGPDSNAPVARMKERPIPLYDAVQGLLDSKRSMSPEAQRERSTVDHCFEQIMALNTMEGSPYPTLLYRLAQSQPLTFGLPSGIQLLSMEVLHDQTLLMLYSRGDSFDNIPRSMIPQVVEICIRLTEWIYGQPEPRRYDSTGVVVPHSLPVQWISRQLDMGIVNGYLVQKPVLTTLCAFFHTATILHPIRDNLLSRTMHTNTYARQFIFWATTVIAREGDASPCDPLLDFITIYLRNFLNSTSPQSDTTDYVFYTAFIFSHALLFRTDNVTEPLAELILVLREYRRRFEPAAELSRSLALNHPQYKWDNFCATSEAFSVLFAPTPSFESNETHSSGNTRVPGEQDVRPGDSVIEIPSTSTTE